MPAKILPFASRPRPEETEAKQTVALIPIAEELWEEAHRRLWKGVLERHAPPGLVLKPEPSRPAAPRFDDEV